MSGAGRVRVFSHTPLAPGPPVACAPAAFGYHGGPGRGDSRDLMPLASGLLALLVHPDNDEKWEFP